MKKAGLAIPNKILSEERLKRKFFQKDVAAQIGTTPMNISRWENGITVPNAYFRHQLCHLYGKSAIELGLLQHPQAKIKRQAINETSLLPDMRADTSKIVFPAGSIGFKRNALFTGREQVLNKLYTMFWSEKTCTKILAICGLGGIGKTQAALEYSYLYQSHYQKIFIVSASTQDVLLSHLDYLARLLRIFEERRGEENRSFQLIREWLNENSNWLLVIDDINDLDLLKQFLPSSIKGHILLTTNILATGTTAHQYHLEGMPSDEGALFLLRRAKYISVDDTLEKISDMVCQSARQIVAQFDGHPLALDQAGAYIEETACSLDDYLSYCQKDHGTLLKVRGNADVYHQDSVAATIVATFQRVSEMNVHAAMLLHFCMQFPYDSVPEKIIIQDPTLPFQAADFLTFNDIIKLLRKYSLINRSSQQKIISVPKIVKLVLKDLAF